MPKFDLKPDEYVVMKSEGVRHGGMMAGFTKELVLTNQNIILISKGVFGNSKGSEHFPLREVKNIDDKPQAIASGTELEIYFLNRHESFGFRSKRDVNTWAKNISKLLSGDAESIRTTEGMAIPGAAYVAETLKDTLETVKHSFGRKSKSSDQEKVATECTSCGAPLSGLAGRIARCQFCDSDQKL
jgi:hypothetical protein